MFIKYQTGFSLIEIFISLLVMSIGILGLGSLQINSVKAANDAYSESVATMLVADLGERMRSNPTGVADGFYGNSSVNCTTIETQCRSQSCTAQQTARFDIQEVMCGTTVDDKQQGGILNLLPQGSLEIDCEDSCEADVAHSITISWTPGAQHKNLSDHTSTLTVEIIP